MKNNPLVSIVLTLYNKEKYILEQLESIKKQTYTNWELTIVNDMSTDSSKNKVLDFIGKHLGLNIKYIENVKNLGVLKTLEKGLKLTNGEYIVICDADDAWMTDKLEKQVHFIKKNIDADLIYHDLLPCDEHMNKTSNSYIQKQTIYGEDHTQNNFDQIIRINHISAATIMFRKKWKNFLIDCPSYCNQQDWWVVLIILGNNGKIFFQDEKLIKYRQNPGSLSYDFHQSKKVLIKNFFNRKEKMYIFLNASKHWEKQYMWLPKLRQTVLSEYYETIDSKLDTISRLTDSFTGKSSKIKNTYYFMQKKMRKEVITLIYFYNVSLTDENEITN